MKRAILFGLAVTSLSSCVALERLARRDFAGAAQATVQAAKDVDWEKVGSSFKEATKNLTPENELYLGRSVAASLLAQNDNRYLDRDAWRRGELAGVTRYVNLLGNRLVAAAMKRGAEDAHSPLAGWHFLVLPNPRPSAYATPGGFVLVTTGLLSLADSEDELAAVLSHEISHVLAGHGLKSISQSRWMDFIEVFGQETSKALGGPKAVSLFQGVVDDVNKTATEGYSQDLEFEADEEGSRIAEAAGYAPGAMVSFLRRLETLQRSDPAAYKSTHAAPDERVAHVQKKNPATRAPVPSGRPTAKRFSEAKASASRG